MSDIAIRVESIGKRYQVGELQQPAYDTLRDNLAKALKTPLQRLSGGAQAALQHQQSNRDFWALNDVSFEVRRGEVVGIIGRNGAGKSTLLKILSRITEPTRGQVEIFGRVGSLLEVGTGFHPELSGRENMYLNGAILGMRKREIDSKIDEIVAFAEVERFFDTPVKNYSSGMFLRLAFAVAAHLEPEILLVDEVLAVGDAAFQKKCLQKMEHVGQQGRTVLFVSHNMQAITRLCDRTIMLDAGSVAEDGPSHSVAAAYMSAGLGTRAAREWTDPTRAPGGPIARLHAARIRTEQGEIADTIDIGASVGVEIEYEVLSPDYVLLPHYHFYNEEGVHIFSAHDVDPEWRQRRRPAGRYTSTAWIPGNLLSEGLVYVEAAVITLDPVMVQFCERDVIAFQVTETTGSDVSARGDWGGRMAGAVRPLLDWRTTFRAAEDALALPAYNHAS